jgi:decaprenylphospho-beta-D-erythro-pentofuranosid-2-ulose 2-reductase
LRPSAQGALSLFLQGLRSRLNEVGVRVITIKPGPVDTPMTKHLAKGAMFVDPKHVATDIYRALEKRTPEIVYTPWKWRHMKSYLLIVFVLCE